MPDSAFPRRNYGVCGSRLGLSEHGRLSGSVEIIQRNFEGDVHDIVEFARGPRVHASAPVPEMRTPKPLQAFPRVDDRQRGGCGALVWLGRGNGACGVDRTSGALRGETLVAESSNFMP
jgi:hypothetical protein